MTKQAVGVVTVLMVGWFLSTPGYAADQTARLPKAVRAGLVHGTYPDKVTGQKIVSVFQNLRKNLILENTRGEKDVKLYRTAAPAVVLLLTNNGLGSGSIIDAKGYVIAQPGAYVVTNWHVVAGNHEVLVFLYPGDLSAFREDLAYKATVERIDEVADLALLRINNPAKSLTNLKLGNGSSLAVGQDVHAIGHPEGEIWTYTKGVISQIRENYEWNTEDRKVHRARVIQTQTPINHGNSGGPLLDDNGRLIGVNSFGKSQAVGLNYAIAVDEIQKFLQRRESRIAPTQQAAGPKPAGLRCPEGYNTRGQGWSDITGCYQDRGSPPPDLWAVFDAPKSLSYFALSKGGTTQIDTFITKADASWHSLLYAWDFDCDGIIDLAGRAPAGGEIESYKPSQNTRLVTLVPELDRALKTGKIPYRNLRVCQ